MLKKMMKYDFLLIISAFAVMPAISYADNLGQNIATNVSSNLSQTAQTQVQNINTAALNAVQNAPMQIANQAVSASQQSGTSGGAGGGAGATAQASNDQLTQGGTQGNLVSAPYQSAETMPQTTTDKAAAALTPAPSFNISEEEQEDPYTEFPEEMGNYNINPHAADENLREQSELMADESIHSDEILASPFSGFSIGISALYGTINGDFKPKVIEGTSTTSFDYDLNDRGVGLGAVFGYGKVFGWFYLGGELLFDYVPIDTTSNIKDSSTGSEKDGTVKTSYDIGLDFKLGGLLSDRVLLYLLLGADFSKFEITSMEAPDFTSSKLSKTVSGIMPGIGLDVALSNSFVMSIQYRNTWYSTINDNFTVATRPGAPEIDNAYDLTRGMFTLGLEYHFN